jgi:hypothetical protein
MLLGLFIKLLVILPSCAPVSAQYFTGAVASGMGGATLGGVEVPESHLLNPAALVHGSAVDIGLFWANQEANPDVHDKVYGLTLASNDSHNYFPGAITYLDDTKWVTGLGTVHDQFLQLSVAHFVIQHVSLGMSVIRLVDQVDALGMTVHQWNGVVGALYNPLENLGVGATFAYFAHPSSTVPDAVRLRPTAGLGVNYIAEDFVTFRFDVLQEEEQNPHHKFIGRAGLESKLDEYFVIRLGYRRDENRSESVFTAGLSFEGPKLKVDYAYEKNLVSPQGGSHNVDLRIPF